jgi:hypothetical protein
LTDLNFDNPSEKWRGELYRREPLFYGDTRCGVPKHEPPQLRLNSKSNLRETECPR